MTLRGNEPFLARAAVRRWCLEWACRRAGAVITVSEQLRDFALRMGADPERTRVIGNGVDAHTFYPRDRRACRQQHGLDERARLILSAGSLLEAKGHHRLIEALPRLHDQGIDAHLVIAGSESRGGPGFERALRAKATKLGLESHVRFTGWVAPSTLAELMCAADVLCLASDSEGWPNVVHEASSCGIPVVSTDVGSVRQMLPSDRYGIIVPVGDQKALEEVLYDALTREWDSHAIASWGQARSWERVAAEVIELLHQVVAKC